MKGVLTMEMQLLVSAMHADAETLVKKMNINSDAIIINQCDTYDYEKLVIRENTIDFYSMNERGIGLSRNNALLRATHEISLFSDSDIEYIQTYKKLVSSEFENHPDADMILFNFIVDPSRRTYHTDKFHKVSLHNCGRYPAYSFAIRTSKMHAHNLTFSLLFGGGAKYSNGEDSLFISNCIKSGLKVYASPICLGSEDNQIPSTWFEGYNEKYFFDRGVLYHFLYGKWAKLLGYRFIYKYRKKQCTEISVHDAYKLLCKGIEVGKKEK